METRKSSPDKKEIRKKHLAIRNAMSEPETAEKSRAICEKLLTSDWYAITDWIFGYYPLGKEADCWNFLKKHCPMADMSPCPVQEQTVPWNFTRSPPWNRPQKAHFTSWNRPQNAAV